MKHRIKGRRLNRSPSHLAAMKRNMAISLFAHERLVTTVPKAKELRSFVEKIITLSKKGAAAMDGAQGEGEEATKARLKALHVRRQLMQVFGGKPKVQIKDDEINVIDKLLNEIGPRFATRPGGYTRILKRTERRLGDAAPTAFIELLGRNEEVKESKAAAPAVTE